MIEVSQDHPIRRVSLLGFAVFVLSAAAACAPPAPPAPGEVESELAAGRLKEAETLAKRLVAAAPEDPEARMLLGRVYLARADGAAAEATFDRAAALGAPRGEVITGLTDALLLQQEYVRVLRLLDEAEDIAGFGDSLPRLRVHALLRIPLASADDLFAGAKAMLVAGGGDAVETLRREAGSSDAIAGNAAHVERAIAYWRCQFAPETLPAPPPLYEPSWANQSDEGRRILRVGPARELKRPSDAAAIAEIGDIVEIDAATYRGDVAVWRADGLWLRSAGGLAVLDSGGRVAGDMGIWVIRGDNTVVDGIRFTGARSSARNGSGIRLLAHNLWVRSSEFHDNEDGILTFNEPGGEVIVERSVFTRNGAGDGYSHNIYVGSGADRLIFRFNYSAGARIGHQVKSRAMKSYILYNRLADEETGSSSYTIDLPNGGFALILGNELQQGPYTVNKHMISLGAEHPEGRDHRFIFAYNTFYNNTSPATFIKDATTAGVSLVNNIFAGASANLAVANNLRVGNSFDAAPQLVAPHDRDYHLEPTAPAIDAGEEIDEVEGVGIVPAWQYRHPAGAEPRHMVWKPDPGAHEFCGWPETEAQ